MRSVTVNVGTFGGGTSANLVPSSAAASLDIRIPLGAAGAARRGRARKACPSCGRFEHTARADRATWTSPGNDIAVAVIDGTRAVLNRRADFDMRVGGSDARLWGRAGVRTVLSAL